MLRVSLKNKRRTIRQIAEDRATVEESRAYPFGAAVEVALAALCESGASVVSVA